MDLLVRADIGAAETVFPRSAIPNGTKLSDSDTKLRAANSLENLGSVSMSVSLGDGPCAKIDAIVSSDLHGPPLISYRDLIKMGCELRFPMNTRLILPVDTPIATIYMLNVEEKFLGEVQTVWRRLSQTLRTSFVHRWVRQSGAFVALRWGLSWTS